jgi:hypothetical protein
MKCAWHNCVDRGCGACLRPGHYIDGDEGQSLVAMGSGLRSFVAEGAPQDDSSHLVRAGKDRTHLLKKKTVSLRA